MAAVTGVAGVVLTAGAPMASVQAFGTVDNGIIGQHAEHEMITRTLSGNAQDGADKRVRWQSATLKLLAGGPGSLGAVGAPDKVTDTSKLPIKGLGPGYKHCDDGDYLATDSYPHSRAKADSELRECIDYYQTLMDRAVTYAGELVDPNQQLKVRETELRCSFGWKVDSSQPAKCEVLNAFGRALHLAEDFWSHSNWADQKAGGPVSTTNPPGLGRTDIPDFLRYPAPSDYQIPSRLITGCDDSVPGSRACKNRVGHSALAKDSGVINPVTGMATPASKYARGKVDNNFQDAVRGARRQARESWKDLQDAIASRYGTARGKLIIDAIATDAPWSECNLVKGSASAALTAPKAGAAGARSVRVQILNDTDQKIKCTSATLNGGAWANGPEGLVNDGGKSMLRTVSSGLVTGTAGSVEYRIGGSGPGDEITITFDNPFVGSNSYSCTVPRQFECVQFGNGRGNSTEAIFHIQRKR